MSQLRSALITLLENGGQLNMDGDLACYSTKNGYYHVEYFMNEENVNSLCLTDAQKKILKKEEELLEIFDDVEEAVDFYLKLTNGRMIPLPEHCSVKKNIKEKLEECVILNKEEYF